MKSNSNLLGFSSQAHNLPRLKEVPLMEVEANVFTPTAGALKEIPKDIAEAAGLKQPTNRRYKTHNRQFNLSRKNEQEQLNEIFDLGNKYRIIGWEKNWDMGGNFKIWVMYQELLTDKQENGTSSNS